jgi:hypothetical protein
MGWGEEEETGWGAEEGGEEDWGSKGGKSGKGKLLGGGALLNAGPAHLLEVGEGPLSFGGEPLTSDERLSVLSTCFSY